MKYDETLLPFLALMRAELAANTSKGDRPGWLTMNADQCMEEIHYHVGKLHWALRHSSERGMAEVVEFSADVANLCMMLLDICGSLAYAPQPPAGVEPWESEFETWWESNGQYCRAGGGHYEKTFAYRAWEAAHAAQQARLQAAEARVAEARAYIERILNDPRLVVAISSEILIGLKEVFRP